MLYEVSYFFLQQHGQTALLVAVAGSDPDEAAKALLGCDGIELDLYAEDLVWVSLHLDILHQLDC